MPDLYCVDTSFLINGWRKHYRIDVFAPVWDRLDVLIEDGTLLSCEEVYFELARQKDELLEWAKYRKAAFQKPTARTIAECKKIMSKYPNFAASGGSTNAADPWVIAHAIATESTVVTDETRAPNQRATKPPRIPDVCDAMGIRWLPPIDFLAEVGIDFK
jgi:hypothetical protein